MSDPNPYRRHDRFEPGRAAPPSAQPSSLADVLDRVLDKGLVIAGDISISLARVELVTIKIRLLVASVDRAREMGIDWWSRDPSLSGGAQELPSDTEQPEEMDPEELAEQNRALMERVQELESRLSGLLSEPESVATKSSALNVSDLLSTHERPSGGGPGSGGPGPGGGATGSEGAGGGGAGEQEAGQEADTEEPGPDASSGGEQDAGAEEAEE